MRQDYSLTNDPIYYVTVGAFALLTTAMPTLLGQPRFLPVAQAVALAVFVAVPLRSHNRRAARNVMALWLVIQYLVMTLLSRSAGQVAEAAINDGFAVRGAVASWLYSGGPLPGGLASEPGARLLELCGVILGSLATAGLVGAWFLARATNLAAFVTGGLLGVIDRPFLLPLAVPVWSLIEIAGYAGLVMLCAEPLLTSNWSPRFYWSERRRLLLVSLGLVVAGFVLELLLPPIWTRGA